MASSTRFPHVHHDGVGCEFAALLEAADDAALFQDKRAGVRAIEALFEFLDGAANSPGRMTAINSWRRSRYS